LLRFRHTCCARCYTTRKTGVTEIVHKPCPFLRAIGRSAAFCLSQSKRLCAENGSNKTSLEKPTCHTLPEVFSVGPLRQRSRGGNCPQASPSFFFSARKENKDPNSALAQRQRLVSHTARSLTLPDRWVHGLGGQRNSVGEESGGCGGKVASRKHKLALPLSNQLAPRMALLVTHRLQARTSGGDRGLLRSPFHPCHPSRPCRPCRPCRRPCRHPSSSPGCRQSRIRLSSSCRRQRQRRRAQRARP